MLHWNETPDKVFDAIVTAALEIRRDNLRLATNGDSNGSDRLLALFGKSLLVSELEKLLHAHKGTALYTPTDWHFFILYDVLDDFVAYCNETLEPDAVHVFGGVRIRKIYFEWVVSVYFWDMDFLVPSDAYAVGKDYMGFSQEVFSIANRGAPFAKPHPEELLLRECNKDDILPGEGPYYKDGEDYPCRKEEGEWVDGEFV